MFVLIQFQSCYEQKLWFVGFQPNSLDKLYLCADYTAFTARIHAPPLSMENIATNQLAGTMIIGGFIKSDDRYYINPYICMGREATLTEAYSNTRAYVLAIFAFCSFHRTSEPSNIDRHQVVFPQGFSHHP